MFSLWNVAVCVNLVAYFDKEIQHADLYANLLQNKMELFRDSNLAQSDKAKKRKVDADGFLMPSSPYEYSSPNNVSPQSFEFGDLENEEDHAGNSCLFSPKKYRFESDGNESHPIQDQTHERHPPSGKGAASQDAQSKMMSILEGLKAEQDSIYDDWSKILQDTEDYENNCIQKLDDMIIEAKNIDENLSKRKETLRQRISEILNVLK